MTIRTFIPVAGFALVTVLVSPALGLICQGKSLSLDEAVDVIKAAPTCKTSMKIFQDCSLGASGDVSLGAAVREKCEADFLAKLKPPQTHLRTRVAGLSPEIRAQVGYDVRVVLSVLQR